ncbi:MAG: hypothetical protein RL119_690 [Actinomycetota bacterium]
MSYTWFARNCCNRVGSWISKCQDTMTPADKKYGNGYETIPSPQVGPLQRLDWWLPIGHVPMVLMPIQFTS